MATESLLDDNYRQCCGTKLCNETTSSESLALPDRETGPGMCFKPRKLEIENPGKIFSAVAVMEGVAMAVYGVVLVVKTTESAGDDVVEAAYLCGMGVFLTFAFVYFALDAVLGENKFQLFSAVLMSILTSGYVLVKYLNVDRTGLGTFWLDSRLYVLIVKASFSLISIILTPFVLDSFGYRAFILIGTDGAMIKKYSRFLQMWTMLRLDLVVNLAMIASYGFLYADVNRLRTAELSTGLSAGATAVGILQVFVGWAAATRENNCLLVLFILFAAVQPVYISYRLFFCFLQADCEDRPQQVSDAFFIAAGAAAVTTKLLLLVSTALVACNFGKGLKEQVFQRQKGVNHA